jgi:hypothetical protein
MATFQFGEDTDYERFYQRDNMISYCLIIILHEILQEAKVKLDVDLLIALSKYPYKTRKVRLKPWDQIFITYDGV